MCRVPVGTGMVFPTIPGVGGGVCVDGVGFDICVEWRYVVVRGGIWTLPSETGTNGEACERESV